MSTTHNDLISQIEKQPPEKGDPVVKMAARLFAELFYKQVMMEREEKARRVRDKQIDGNREKGYTIQ